MLRLGALGYLGSRCSRRPRELSDVPTDTNSRLVAPESYRGELKRFEEARSDARGLVEKRSAIVSINAVGRILSGQRSSVGRMLTDNPIMILTLLGLEGASRLETLEE